MYEVFRNQLSQRLLPLLSADALEEVLHQLDAVAADYKIERQCTDLITVSDEPEAVKMYLAALAVSRKARGTLLDYRRKLVRFFGAVRKPFDSVTANDVRCYLFKYQEEANLKKSSLSHVRTVLFSFYEWLVNQGCFGISKNPVKLVDPIHYYRPKLPALQPIDLEYIRDACQAPREIALIDFLVSTGCRISECAAVKLMDINWADRSVIIPHGKGDKPRTVYFNAKAEVSMRNYLKSKEHISEYLFSNSRAPYGRISAQALRKEHGMIRERVKDKISTIPTMHSYRRTFATTARNNGMPLENIQALLGHENISTSMQYINSCTDQIKTSYDQHMR